MDQFFTSLSKRQTMMLLTAITFGGQEGVAALEHLPEEEAELLQHRAQEILQIPREKRIPLLVQEIKRLVKDRRGQLWSADPERLARLLRRERLAVVEVVLRALPATLADAVRSHLPSTGKVRFTREVRPQVLDIVRWKLEELLARESSPHVQFKFTDVLLLQTRELLTVCDRLGARVLGPALAGLPDEEREPAFAVLPPHMRQLATRAVSANAPRKLDAEDAKAQLEQYGGVQSLAAAIRGAGVHRLARACVAQSPEFAARLLEKHRGELGQILVKWVREERSKPTTRGDGGRTDIVTDLERLAARGLIERPVRVTPVRPPALGPPPGAPKSSPPSARAPALSREVRSSAGPDSSVRRSVSSQVVPSVRRDPIAEREARRAGVAGPGSGGRQDEAREPSRVARGASRNAREDSAIAPDPTGARIGPPPSRGPTRSRVEEPAASSEVSRIIRAPVSRSQSRSAMPRSQPEEGASERPPRVVRTNNSLPAVSSEGTQDQRRDRPGVPPSRNGGRGPRGGTR